jgi:drug/metabolite transporter (DMT)-like permease
MLAILIPLLCALVYVLAALTVRRGLDRGADLWGSLVVNFWTMAGVFLLALPFASGPVPWDLWWQPAVVGVLSFCGQTAGYKAISSGDLTIATPALGSKVLLVALLTRPLLGESVPLAWWVAAVLSFAAMVFLQSGLPEARRDHRVTLAWSLLAAASFALGDVLIQRWAPRWGVFRFMPALAGMTALLSLCLLPLVRRPRFRFGRTGWSWILPGALLMGLQSLGFTVVLGLYGKATLANILFSSRGLWSFLLIWYGGHLFGNRERETGGKVMALRLLGAGLMFAAIVIASLS